MRKEDGPGALTRAAVRRWIRNVMHMNGWSAEEWARRAQTTPTNITRILAGQEYFSLPNADTLARLARAAGTQPDFLDDDSENGKGAPPSVPLLDGKQARHYLRLGKAERARYIAQIRAEHTAVQILFRPLEQGLAIILESDSLRGRALIKGDCIVIDPVTELGSRDAGTIICALVSGKIGAWLWFPPLLVPAHDEESPVISRNIPILGRAVQLVHRSLEITT